MRGRYDLLSNRDSRAPQTNCRDAGARREGVTEESGKLQAAGLISYSRARIEVLDEAGLKKKSCDRSPRGDTPIHHRGSVLALARDQLPGGDRYDVAMRVAVAPLQS